MNNNHLIIMAGGIGSRFWPMSTPEMPKQFIDILGIGKTMIQLTVERFSGVVPIENIWVVTSKKYKDIVSEQIKGISEENILLEPCMRNTAPCIAYVSWKIRKKFKNANLIFSPADHLVMDVDKFQSIINVGLDFISNSDKILTLGMEPTRPETGYGYIKENTNIKIEESYSNIKKVEAFKEKPSLELAKEYIIEGGYFWNAGIFLWNVNTVIKSIEKFLPDIADIFNRVEPSMFSPEEQNTIDKEFPSCQNISIDYAIMEKSSDVYVLPSSFGWSDLGTWGSLYNQLEKDKNTNAVVSNCKVKLVDCENCMVHTPENMSVVIQGIKDSIIAVKDGRLLICKRDDEQLIKEWSVSVK